MFAVDHSNVAKAFEMHFGNIELQIVMIFSPLSASVKVAEFDVS